MQKEIKHTFYFNQKPEEIWEYLTNPELMALWMMPSDFKPVVGHHFRFTNPNNTFVVCEVTKVNPVTQLSYIWKNDWGSNENAVQLRSKLDAERRGKRHGTVARAQRL